MKRALALSIALVTASITLHHAESTATTTGKPNQHVLPINSKPYGQSYAEWSAEFWQWLYSLPVDKHPLFDTADCSEGQSGKVWFLGGTFTTVEEEPGIVIGTAERECTVPAGKALFFPIINAEANTIGSPDATEEELRAEANFLGDHIEMLQCTIDGQKVNDLDVFRTETPLFLIGPLPDNNVLGVDAGTMAVSVGDGFYLMLNPLPKGEHTIHFSGAAIFTMEEDGFDFIFALDITYHITVE